MKIVQITPFFYPVKGGMEEHVFQVSKGLVEKGHRVEVLTSDSSVKGRIKQKFEIIDDIPVYRFTTLFGLGDFGKIWPGFVFKLLKERSDIVHVHNYRHLHTILAIIICKLKRIPCILTTHSPFHPITTRRFISRVFIFFYDFFLAKIFDRAFSKIILINNSEKKYFSCVDKQKVVIIPNGIKKTYFKKLSKSFLKTLRKKFGINNKDKIILFVGRIHPTKGLHFLLSTFFYMLKHNKNLKLIIVGPIQDKKYFYQLKNFIETQIGGNNIIFTDFISEEEKLGLYDISSVFVLPSIYEPFGIVILEAFARGKPVIAVDSDGPRYLVKAGENGFLINYGDEKNLRLYIEKLIDDKKLYKKISKNNRAKAINFLWNKIVNQLIKVYEEVKNENT